MENNEPLLKEEKENLAFASEEKAPENVEVEEAEEIATEEVTTPDKEEEKEPEAVNTDFVVEEKYQKEVIKPVATEEHSQKDAVDNKKSKITLVVTLVLTAIVAYLLVRTCLGFYYGFRYKDYVPEATTTEQP